MPASEAEGEVVLARGSERSMIDCETEQPNTFPQVLHVRAHTLRADVAESAGGTDSAAVARCPIHKLMTTSEVVIETAPIDGDR